jgi:hypothetical protein
MFRMYNLLMMMYYEWLRIKIDRGRAFLSGWSALRRTQLIPSLEASKQVQPQRHESGGLERLRVSHEEENLLGNTR